MKKLFIALLVLGTLTATYQVRAQQSSSEVQTLINELLRQIQVLQIQIQALGGSVAPVSSTVPSTSTNTTPTNLTSDLRQGQSGVDVSALQRRLTSLGFYNDDITGYFGPITYRAVQEFQRANGISGTGYVGRSTRASLNSNNAISYAEAARRQAVAQRPSTTNLSQNTSNQTSTQTQTTTNVSPTNNTQTGTQTNTGTNTNTTNSTTQTTTNSTSATLIHSYVDDYGYLHRAYALPAGHPNGSVMYVSYPPDATWDAWLNKALTDLDFNRRGGSSTTNTHTPDTEDTGWESYIASHQKENPHLWHPEQGKSFDPSRYDIYFFEYSTPSRTGSRGYWRIWDKELRSWLFGPNGGHIRIFDDTPLVWGAPTWNKQEGRWEWLDENGNFARAIGGRSDWTPDEPEDPNYVKNWWVWEFGAYGEVVELVREYLNTESLGDYKAQPGEENDILFERNRSVINGESRSYANPLQALGNWFRNIGENLGF